VRHFHPFLCPKKYAAAPTMMMIKIQIQAGTPPDFSCLMTAGAVRCGFGAGRAVAGLSARTADAPDAGSARGALAAGVAAGGM
jgi:hypothetical protein